ncbi:hypothetical protein Godav_025506 [Gossypium davidsonii]|uniref:Uncharacterized protein n=1 Tax=Gossypium davidsonii TaxID=34287 RepID=A0A7J8TE49_GOSDV|nr:hypothetical protein [Gossypium davidsonii]
MMRSSLMMTLHFTILVFELILKCCIWPLHFSGNGTFFYLMLSQKVLGDILRGENTISSMA